MAPEASTSTEPMLRRSTSPRAPGSRTSVASSWARMLPRALASGVPTMTRRWQAAAVMAGRRLLRAPPPTRWIGAAGSSWSPTTSCSPWA